MRKLWMALAVCALAGCANVDELRRKNPVANFSAGEKSPADVASCITAAWTDQRIGLEANGAGERRDGDRFVVVSPPSGYPSEVAEVSPKGPGADVSIYAQTALDVGARTDKRVQAAKACQ